MMHALTCQRNNVGISNVWEDFTHKSQLITHAGDELSMDSILRTCMRTIELSTGVLMALARGLMFDPVKEEKS